jgi:hypothetical protein
MSISGNYYLFILNLKTMASKSETGHAVNLANFKLLIDRCTAFGAKYAPSNPDISIANMNSLWNLAYTAQTTIRQTEQGAKQPVNAREILFDPLSGRVTQVINLLKSTKASTQVKEDAKSIADIIRGFNARKPKQTEGETNVEAISKSQQGFVQRAEQFSTLIELLKTIPEYTPSEGSLSIPELENYYSQLKARPTMVWAAH